MHSVGLSPALWFINLGFLPVDGFFVLTGFLIAYPLFKEEARRLTTIIEGEKDGSNDKRVGENSPWTFDLGTFYYRRVTRMLPSYLLAVYFHCGLLFPGGIQHSMSLARSNSFRNFIERVLPGTVDAPNSCTPEKLFTNFTFMNHLMPFGGCMGWTWTFALQFNFYLFFPLLWNWANRRLRSMKPSPNKTPSSFVMPFLYTFLLLSVCVRIITFFQLRLFDLRHEEGVFLGFFWYSNTLTRGGGIIWGVVAAYGCTRTSLVAWMKLSSIWINLGWFFVLTIVLAQMFWNKIFSTGNMVETPGWSTLELTQLLGGEESKRSIFQPNVLTYWWHAMFHIFVLVGSPLSNGIFVFLLLVIVNGVGRLGRAIQTFFSFDIWFPISTLSWWVYLVHPAIMQRFYASYVEAFGDLPASVTNVYTNIAIQWTLSFMTACIAYCFVEQPLEILLRQGEAANQTNEKKVTAGDAAINNGDAAASSSSKSSPITFYTVLRKLIFIYCVFAMVYIILHHLAMTFAVTQLEPKPYIPLPNALPETKRT